MKVLGHDLIGSPDVPPDEVWLAIPTGSHPEQKITPAGDLMIRVVQEVLVLGKITGLAS